MSQHDNNRDGMGQYLELTKHTTRTFLEWTPTVLHDLHEAQTYLYSSTGSGPYNEAVDPITVDEWWVLAKNDVMEMTKRGVPGVWTYGFYDGWTPNYMFFIAHTHNAIGRFYEVQSYGPDNYVQRTGNTTTSREWFRPNPPLPIINWGPRANVNIQQSGVLFSLSRMAKDRRLFLENYWLKNKRAVERGKTGPISGWVIPASQHAAANAAEAVNDLRTQGLEFHVATAPFKAGHVQVQAGDWIVRGDQPYRTIADMYFSLQNFAISNPSPYDDTGWTFPLMRNMTILPVGDVSLLAGPMAPVTADVRAAGGITGKGSVVAIAASRDNALVSFRFKLAKVPMRAADAAFDAGGQHFEAGTFLIPNANRAQLDAVLKPLGLAACGVAGDAEGRDARPRPAAHRLHPLVDAHPGRRVGPRSVRPLRRAVRLLRRADGARGQPARQVRRDRLSARRQRRRAGGAGGWQAAAVPRDEGVPVARLPRLEQRHPRRPRRRRNEGTLRIRARRRDAHHRGEHGTTFRDDRPPPRGEGGAGNGALCPRDDPPWRAHRPEVAAHLWLRTRRGAGLLQPEPDPQRRQPPAGGTRRRAGRLAGARRLDHADGVPAGALRLGP
ncbi:MAG: hypothetical protein V9E87_12670 [Gemmatimonadales bacterium]